MAHKTFYVDEVMAAHDQNMHKPVPGYRFSNGRSFHGQNEVETGVLTQQAADVALPVTPVIKLSVFQGTPWNDAVGVWSDNEVWKDG